METTIPSTTSTGTWYYTDQFAPLTSRQPRPKLDFEAERGWDEVIDKLLVFRGYKEDWDGEGSLAPGKDLVDGAITLLQVLRESEEAPPIGAATTDEGTVIIEWRWKTGNRILEVVSPTEAEFRWVPIGPGKPKETRYFRRA